MSALEICRKRTVCAVLASGVVISLTALTGGMAPAFADPGSGPAGPTTTIVPEPTVAVTEAPVEKTTVAEIPAPAAPTQVVVPTAEAPPAVVVPTVQETAEAPPQTRAPEPVAPTTAATSAKPPAQVEAPAGTPPPVTATTTSPAPSTLAPSTPAPTSAAPPPALASETAATSSSASASARSESSEPSSQSAESSSKGSPSSSESESAKKGRESDSSSADSSSPDATPKVIDKVAPQTLEAPEQDVQLARAAKVLEAKPTVAPAQEIADISRMVDLPNRDKAQFDGNGQRNDDQVRLAGNWDRNVRQWRPDWVEYDEYYRPVLSNPYRDPVRIVYMYQNAPQVAFIPPLGRIVLEVAQFAAYSFTALVTNPINEVLNVAVGSFFGGGYVPGVGLPFPPAPPALLNFADVPVQVRYPDATYQPFRVSKIVDVGPDIQYGEQKVLLDGVTPAWGEWKQTPSGERSFEVHKTQQFPGLDDPRPGPLPGDYQLTLASDESPAGMNKRDVYLVAVAVACGVLSIGAVVLAVFMGRRRRPLH